MGDVDLLSRHIPQTVSVISDENQSEDKDENLKFNTTRFYIGRKKWNMEGGKREKLRERE